MASEVYTLMCLDREAVEFSWNSVGPGVGVMTGGEVLDARYLPIGTFDKSGNFSRSALTAWIFNRCVPDTRPDALKVASALGYKRPADLMLDHLGTSLSDCYWFKPAGSDAVWADINPYGNPFSPTLGDALQPLCTGSAETPALDASAPSPDAALNGNLPKRWVPDAHRRVLLKAGCAANRFQEPYNEVIASQLCERLLDLDQYVPYWLETGARGECLSACYSMVDGRTEYVPAIHLLRSFKRGNSEHLRDFFTRVCVEHGLDPRAVGYRLDSMAVVDFIMANYDRHWNNFGIIMDSETREWLDVAPIFDTGNSLWCDRAPSEPLGGYFMPADTFRPFTRDIDSQLDLCGDLAWLDTDLLDDFPDLVAEVLGRDGTVARARDRIPRICEAVRRRIAHLSTLANGTAPR